MAAEEEGRSVVLSEIPAATPSPAPAPCSGSSSNKKTAFANPAPLGLLAFGMTTVLLNFRNSRAISPTGAMSMVFAMGAAFGGFAQIVAGILEFIQGNTFGMLAFLSYGCFWESFVLLNIFATLGVADANDPGAIAMYLFFWGLFTLGMACATVKHRHNRCGQALFFSLAVLFFILALGDLVTKTGHESAGIVIGQIAGVEGIFVGALAIYMALAEVNGWPVFPVSPKKSN